MIDKLQAHQNQILFIELAGLLHDIGKLSSKFLKYRQTWHTDPKGYDNDPHDHYYLDKHETLRVPAAFFREIEKQGLFELREPDFSIKKAIHDHTKPGDADLITRMLNAADSIDSAFDRNNPLWSAEQTVKKCAIFKSNVFGFENGRTIDVDAQDEVRRGLFEFLNNSLPAYFETFSYDQRKDIIERIKHALQIGLSDTTRPQNDTTLWEHSYAVASILKVMTVYNLFVEADEKMMLRFDDVRFGILGVGWDGMAFLSYGQKIRDIIGRKDIIENTKCEIKKLLEYTYPVGNEIYADDDGIYFIVPAAIKHHLPDIWSEVEKKIYDVTADKSQGELQPHIADDVTDTNTLTSLLTAIRTIKKKAASRFDSSVGGFKYCSRYWESFEKDKTICPICRIRPVEKENADKKICKTCRKRRHSTAYRNDSEQNKETIFIDEIADKEKGAALITARFMLDDWLHGDMIRSLFVTEAHGIKDEVDYLGKVEQFKEEETEIKDFFAKHDYGPFDYNRIKADIDALMEETDADRAIHTAFLYDRRVMSNSLFRDTHDTRKRWRKMHESAEIEHEGITLYNVLNAKTPTASTILDVWDTTLEFFQKTIAGVLESQFSELFIRPRLVLLPLNGENLSGPGKGTLDAMIIDTSEKLELLSVDINTVEIVGEKYDGLSAQKWPPGRRIQITDIGKKISFEILKCIPGNTYAVYRTVTISPNLFMAIVPATRAVEISNLVYQEYIDQFGKMIGRLPFSIGNLFFKKAMPMFVVLDAAKRMIANFDRLAKNGATGTVKDDAKSKEQSICISLECALGGLTRNITWELPTVLGNCEMDYYHPYFIVDSGNKYLADGRSTFFETVAGDVVHFDEIRKGDRLKLHPNYYDFEYLDSNTRRYDVNLDADGRRKSSVAGFRSKPFLLDELSEKIVDLWKSKLQGRQFANITDTKLRNLQSLWLTKYQEWEVNLEDKNTPAYKGWLNLVKTSLLKEFGRLDELLLETLENGVFFDTLELLLGIMKERIGIEKGGNANEQTV